MPKLILRGLLASALLFPCSVLHAQAFGVIMGDPVSKYAGHRSNGDTMYTITVPKPNSEFELYMAYATPATGICAVSAAGKTHEADSYGVEIRSAFDRIKNSLSEKYGRSKDFNYLKAGSIWREPNEFGWAIYKNERSLISFWDRDEGSVNLADIKGVMLKANAVGPDKLYLTLRYEFNNIDTCRAILNGKDNEGL